MTRILEEEKKCKVCGTVSKHWQLHGFIVNKDQYELDGKGMCNFPQECPCCGYVSYDLNQEPCEKIKVLLQSEEYVKCKDMRFRTPKQRALYRQYLISRELEDVEDQFDSLCKASWEEVEPATKKDNSEGDNYYGKLALKCIDRLIQEKPNEALFVIKAELLRLNSFFERVINEFSDMHLEDESLEKKMSFIVSRAMEKDCKRYRIVNAENGDVESVYERAQRVSIERISILSKDEVL